MILWQLRVKKIDMLCLKWVVTHELLWALFSPTLKYAAPKTKSSFTKHIMVQLSTLAFSPLACHPSSLTALSLLWGRWVFCWSQGQGTPAHHRALTDGRGCHARCQPHIRSNLGFSILLKDTSTCSAQPGAGIWTSNLPITSRPALPAELQPPPPHSKP